MSSFDDELLLADKLNGLQATAGEIDGVVGRANTIVLLGDSITAGNSNEPSVIYTVSTGQFSWANSILGHPFDVVYNAGIGGQTSSQILARVDSDVISRNPSYCMYLCGMNDGTTDSDTATLKNNISEIYEKLNNAGIYSFILTNTVAPATSAKNNQAININSWMKTYFYNKPNVRIIDLFSAWINPTSTTFAVKSNVLRDAVHPSNVGGFLGGIKIASALSDFTSKYQKIASSADDYSINNKSLNILKNPLLLGTTGTLQGGVTGGVATSFKGYCGNGSVVASKETRADGFGDNQVYAITATNSSCVARLESFTMGYLPLVGETVQYEAEVFIASGAVGLSRVQMYAFEVLSPICGDIGSGSTPHYGLPIPTDGITITLKTPKYTYSANSVTPFVRIEAYFAGAGSATIKIGRVSCVKS